MQKSPSWEKAGVRASPDPFPLTITTPPLSPSFRRKPESSPLPSPIPAPFSCSRASGSPSYPPLTLSLSKGRAPPLLPPLPSWRPLHNRHSRENGNPGAGLFRYKYVASLTECWGEERVMQKSPSWERAGVRASPDPFPLTITIPPTLSVIPAKAGIQSPPFPHSRSLLFLPRKRDPIFSPAHPEPVEGSSVPPLTPSPILETFA